jgi:hypothetical protein
MTASASVSDTILRSSGGGDLKDAFDLLTIPSEDPYKSSSSHEFEIFSQTFVIYLQGRMRKIYPAGRARETRLEQDTKVC